MIIEFFERLRARPLGERQRFALLASLCITGIIALLWSVTLPSRLSSLQIPIDKVKELDMPAAPEAATDGLQGIINVQNAVGGPRPQNTPTEYGAYREETRPILIGTSSTSGGGM